MNDYHLAQLNIANMKTSIDDPSMQGFVDNLEVVNAIADSSPGFVWRLKTEEGDATSITIFGNDMLLVNMSVWESVEDLKIFVYESFNLEIFKRKKEWFDKFEGVHQVMWWLRPGSTPTVEEAEARLLYLQVNGETAYAFNFRRTFPPSDQHLELPLE